MRVSPTPRLGSGVRGGFIAAFVAIYGWFIHHPGTSLEVAFLVAAVLQLTVILMRRFVPAEYQAEAFGIYEIMADGASVLLFAVGVFGGIAGATTQF